MNALDASPSALRIDDAALTQRVTTLVRSERKHLVEFLRHLAEFDARRLYLGLGYSSIYVYCRDALRLSDGSAHRRYTVGRLMTRFPVIAEYLEDGRLNLKRVSELRDVLTVENHLDLLDRAVHGTEKDVELLAASLKPRPDVKDSIRRVSDRIVATSATAPAHAEEAELLKPSPSSAESQPHASPAAPTPAVSLEPAEPSTSSGALLDLSSLHVREVPRPRRMEVEATSGTAFSVRMSVSPEFIAEFEAVKAELSHKIPDGNFEDIFRECFRVTLDALQRRRTSKAHRPASGDPETPQVLPSPKQAEPESREPSRYIPVDVQEAVWARDGGSCAFVGSNGKRCSSRHQVQFHHVIPYAAGGPTTKENLSLRCRAHNAFEAELAFGTEFMRAKTSGARRSTADSHFHQWKCNEAGAKSAAGLEPGAAASNRR